MEQTASGGYRISITEDIQGYFKNNEIHPRAMEADRPR